MYTSDTCPNCTKLKEYLKQNNIEYSIHGVGGCTCCGLELRQEGKSYPTDKILEVINGYLKNHWIYVQENKYQDSLRYDSLDILG